MGDIVNGRLCEAFVKRFEKDLIDRVGISFLHGDAMVSKQLAWEHGAFEVRVHYIIRDADGDEHEVHGATVYYTPDGDDEWSAELITTIIFGVEYKQRHYDEILQRIKDLPNELL